MISWRPNLLRREERRSPPEAHKGPWKRFNLKTYKKLPPEGKTRHSGAQGARGGVLRMYALLTRTFMQRSGPSEGVRVGMCAR